MTNEIWLEGSWRECIEITVDSGDMKMNATVTRKAFEEALANIDGDISEWMAKRVISWIRSEEHTSELQSRI